MYKWAWAPTTDVARSVRTQIGFINLPFGGEEGKMGPKVICDAKFPLLWTDWHTQTLRLATRARLCQMSAHRHKKTYKLTPNLHPIKNEIPGYLIIDADSLSRAVTHTLRLTGTRTRLC
jgi:hypothetical protein